MPSSSPTASAKIAGTRYAGEFGNIVRLTPISVTTDDTTKTNNKTLLTKKTRVVKITEHTWEKLRDFSSKYHEQPISYDDIFEELVDFYNEKHEKKYF